MLKYDLYIFSFNEILKKSTNLSEGNWLAHALDAFDGPRSAAKYT